MADAANLNVSRSVVQRLWDQYQSEDSVSKRPVPGRPRATTPAEDRAFSSSFGTKEITVPQLVADHFHQEEESPLLRASTDLENSALDTINPTLLKDTVIEVAESWFGQGSRSVATNLHVFHGGTVTGLRYRDEILDPYVRPYSASIGNDFILMDDNARPHRAWIVEEYRRSRFGTNGMASSISRPESDRTSLGLSWQRGFCFKSSSKVVT
ncbi:uncharacterized protein TNCV_1942981 [Trichonephila clavipes]|nr:uncharacterized protein TNCV_1942981 [Trichonephila clavipes]